MKFPWTLVPLTSAPVIRTCADPEFPEMTWRLATDAPPTVVFCAPSWILTPTRFDRAAVPAAVRPMRFPLMVFEAVPIPWMTTPSPDCPEMTFPPPTVLVVAPPSILTPTPDGPPLGIADDPVASVPMRFPSTTSRMVWGGLTFPWMSTPPFTFPEMRLPPLANDVPPTTVFCDP